MTSEIKKQKTKINNKLGFTLIEILVSLFVLSVVSVSLYSAYNFFFQVMSEKKNRVEALAIANEKMEIVRNMAYNDIGTVGGIPTGTIPQSEVVVRNKTNFTVQIQVAYIDDPFDGTLGGTPDDLLPTDYKRIRVAVSWVNRFNTPTVNLISDIAPRDIETTVSGGTLAITVFDANGAAVSNANIHIVNTAVSPTIDITTESNSAGKAIFPGAPESNEGYQITVTKNGYSTDQTYPRTTQMPHPVKPNASIIEKQVTQISFAIDLLSALNIYTYNNVLIRNWKINTDSGSADQASPTLASDPNGNFYFAWNDDRQSGNNRVYAQKYNSSLVKQWSGDLRISNANKQLNASMAGDDSGNTYIAWNDDSSGNQDVYVIKVGSTGGNPWNGSKKVNTNSGSSDQILPNVVRDGANLYISWTDYRNGNADIYLHKIDTNKNYVWGNEIKVNSDVGNTNQISSRATVLNNNVYLTWTDYRDGNADIYLQKISPAGTKLWTEDLKVNSGSTATDQISPALANDGSNIYLAWADSRDGSPAVYMQKINPSGTKLWLDDIKASEAGDAIAATPTIAVSSEPKIYLAWIDNRNGNSNLFGQIFDTDGNRLNDFDEKINDDLGTAEQKQPQIIFDSAAGGRVIYAWVDDRNGNDDIYASGYSGTIPLPHGNVPVIIKSSKLIATNPNTYKYNQNFTTDSQGSLTLPEMEWDSYTITASGHTIKNANPGNPVPLDPDATQTAQLFVE